MFDNHEYKTLVDREVELSLDLVAMKLNRVKETDVMFQERLKELNAIKERIEQIKEK